MPSMSAIVRPASSTAASTASTVSARPSIPSRRPTFETPAPLMTALRSPCSPDIAHRLEQRQEDVLDLFEQDLDEQPDADLFRRATHDVRGQPQARLLGEFGDRHDER